MESPGGLWKPLATGVSTPQSWIRSMSRTWRFLKDLGWCSCTGRFESNHQTPLAPPTTMTCHSTPQWIPCSHAGLSLTTLNTHTHTHTSARDACLTSFRALLQHPTPMPSYLGNLSWSPQATQQSHFSPWLIFLHYTINTWNTPISSYSLFLYLSIFH